jgi:hypothetical protein
VIPDDLCSRLSEESGESLTATAPTAAAYLLLEQPGPWGRKAPSTSHLDRALGAELDARAKAARVTLLLVRRPGRHPDNQPTHRAVLAAHTLAGRLQRAEIDDPADLLALDFAALAAGADIGLGAPPAGPVVLVCTNARRDRCCAITGRPLVEALAAVGHGAELWESAHIGGHRFAPTVLLLPSGVTLGRATPDQVLAALHGRLPLDRYRGRAGLDRVSQAAETYVLRLLGQATPLQVGGPEGAGPWQVTVRDHDGQVWRVDVERRVGRARPESCGREPEPAESFVGMAARSIGR